MPSRICRALALLVILHAGTSRADDDPREAARAHFARGIELAKQSLYEAALEQFNDAYAKSPHFAVLYNIGQAQMALGRPLEAIEALTRYLREGADQVPLSRREQVQAQIGLLESRLAELSITTNPAGATIRVDGRDVGRTPLFQPVRLAAGTHAVSASLPDGAQVTRAVTLAEAERQRLELDLTAATTAAKPPPALALAAAPPEVPARVAERPSSADADARDAITMRRTAYILAGAGVLSGGAALGVYMWNRGRYDDWRASNALLQTQMPGSAAYRARATANNALAESLTTANHAILALSIVGGALIAAGGTLFLVDRGRNRRGGELSFGWDGGSSANVGWSAVW